MKLLIAAGQEAPNADDVPESVRTLIDSAEEILVISPPLPSRLNWLASATDNASEKADERLQTVLSHLDEMGSPAEGEVAADDPMQAFDDAIRQFGPDHVLIAVRSEDEKSWQEKDLLEQVQWRFGIPMTVFQFPG